MSESRPKLMFALSLEDEASRSDSRAMPLHVAITPPFRTESSNIGSIEVQSDGIAASIPNFEIVGNDEAQFGGLYPQRVRKIGSSTLIAVHEAYLELATKYDDSIDTRYVGRGYVPHATFQDDKGVGAEEVRLIETI